MQWKTAKPTNVHAQFLEDPISFMRQNIVRVDYADPVVTQTGGLGYFKLVAVDQPGKTFHGESIPVYSLQDGRNELKRCITAYWCPYVANGLKMTTVGNQADVMFTETMTGCTFAVGSVASNGTQLVGHANSMDVGYQQGLTQQSQAQHGQVTARFGNTVRMLEPDKYRLKPGEQDELIATTFGVRGKTTNTWSYYTQLRELDQMGTLILRSVKKI